MLLKKVVTKTKIKLSFLEEKRYNLLTSYLEQTIKELTAKKVSNLTMKYINAGLDPELSFYKAINKFYPKQSKVLFGKMLSAMAGDKDILNGIIRSYFEKNGLLEFFPKYSTMLSYYFKNPHTLERMAAGIKLNSDVTGMDQLWEIFDKVFYARIEHYISVTNAYIRRAS